MLDLRTLMNLESIVMDNKKRLINVRDAIRGQFEAILVNNPANVRYLSGFTGSNGSLLISEKESLLITDFRYLEQAQEESPDWKVVKQEGKISAVLKTLAHDLKLSSLAFEKNTVTFAQWESWAKVFDGLELKPSENIIENLRLLKDAEEITCLEQACHITDHTFEEIQLFIRPGVTERELAWHIKLKLHEKGSEKPAFPPIVAFGERAALPHISPSDRVLKQGDFVLLDFGAVVKGYHSDFTRTLIMGKASEEQEQRYALVLQAQQAAIDMCSPQLEAKKADEAARAVFKQAGVEEFFGHGLGHGVGLEVHEGPVVSVRSDDRLIPGMAFTIEPGLYFTGWGGIRIEDTVVLTKEKLRVLTHSPKELHII